jgi:hypothetical protein
MAVSDVHFVSPAPVNPNLAEKVIGTRDPNPFPCIGMRVPWVSINVIAFEHCTMEYKTAESNESIPLTVEDISEVVMTRICDRLGEDEAARP